MKGKEREKRRKRTGMRNRRERKRKREREEAKDICVYYACIPYYVYTTGVYTFDENASIPVRLLAH